MKFITLISALTLLTSTSLAQLSPQDQIELVESVAKSERRTLWRQGLQDVESSVEKVIKKELVNKIEETNKESNAERFSPAEVSALNACAIRTDCELFLIEIYVNEMGGTGILHAYVALETLSARYQIIRRWIFEE